MTASVVSTLGVKGQLGTGLLKHGKNEGVPFRGRLSGGLMSDTWVSPRNVLLH